MHNIALPGGGGGGSVVVAMRRIGAAVAALTVTATVMQEQISCCWLHRTCWHGSVQRRMANSVERSNRKGTRMGG